VQKTNKALTHNCIGAILSIGVVGTINPNNENPPLITINAIIIITSLFIDIYYLHYNIS